MYQCRVADGVYEASPRISSIVYIVAPEADTAAPHPALRTIPVVPTVYFFMSFALGPGNFKSLW